VWESLRRLKHIVPYNASKRRRWEKWHWDGVFFLGLRVFLVSTVPTVIRIYYTDRLLSPLNLLLRTDMGRSAPVWEITQRRLVCLPTFRYILPVPSWMVKSSWTTWPVKMGLLGCSITFVANYQSTLRNIPEERRPHLHGNRSFKSVNVTRGFSVDSRSARSWSTPPVTM
jgi:hypothetical protein